VFDDGGHVTFTEPVLRDIDLLSVFDEVKNHSRVIPGKLA